MGERHRRFNKLGKTTYRNSLSQQQQDSRQVVIKQEPVQLGRGYRNKAAQMPMRIVLDMDDDIVALVTRKHTESRMLPSLWKAVSVFCHRNHAFIRDSVCFLVTSATMSSSMSRTILIGICAALFLYPRPSWTGSCLMTTCLLSCCGCCCDKEFLYVVLPSLLNLLWRSPM